MIRFCMRIGLARITNPRQRGVHSKLIVHMNKIELIFKDRIAIDRGTYFLFTKNDSIDFIKECRIKAVIILGIDGFYKIDKNTIQPSLENSIDFSNLSPSINKYDTALEFITTREDKLYFEIICVDF